MNCFITPGKKKQILSLIESLLILVRSFIEELDRKRIKHLASTMQDIVLTEIKCNNEEKSVLVIFEYRCKSSILVD